MGDEPMYLPPVFREDRVPVQHELIRTHPLGLLISGGPGGLAANPIPFLVYAEEGSYGTLRAHMAKANPQWRGLADAGECLVVFQGEQRYISPSWYATTQESGKVVPTWNYATVHAWGTPRVINDAAWLRRQIEDLTRSREEGRPEPWRVSDAPEEFLETQIRAIIGVEIPISRLEGKWKVSQNRTEADRRGVLSGLRSEGGGDDGMATLIAERARGK